MYTITEEVLHASTASKGCEDNHISLAKDGLLFPFLDSLPVLVLSSLLLQLSNANTHNYAYKYRQP